LNWPECLAASFPWPTCASLLHPPNASVFPAIWFNRRFHAIPSPVTSVNRELVIHAIANPLTRLLHLLTKHSPHRHWAPTANATTVAYIHHLHPSDADRHHWLILLFALTSDPVFRDPQERDVVVVTSTQTLYHQGTAKRQCASSRVGCRRRRRSQEYVVGLDRPHEGLEKETYAGEQETYASAISREWVS
jgi:hypothetical protein